MNDNGTQPRFRQIADHIRTRILGGDLSPGDEVPSQRAIAIEYDVSRPTATRALELLQHEGFVHSVQGSGTFVSAVSSHRRAKERYQRAKSSGRIYGEGERAEILAAELVESPPAHVADSLQLDPETAAIRRRRLIWAGDEDPVEVSTSWFDGSLAARAPRLLASERIRSGTLAYIEERSGRTASYASDRIGSRSAGTTDAKDLRLGKTGAPVLVVEHTVYDSQDRPLEFVEAVYPSGRWTYEQRYDLD